jgi:hypothetical protein
MRNSTYLLSLYNFRIMRLLVAVILLLVLNAFPQAKPNASRPTTAAAKESDSPQTLIGQQTINPAPTTQSRESVIANGIEHRHDWIDKVNAFSTAVIAFFTVLLFVGVILQVSTSRQIERGWVMADLCSSPLTTLIDGKSAKEGYTTALMHVELRCSNNGRSPVWVTEKAVRLVVATEEDLSDVPQLTSEDIIQHDLEALPPDGKPNSFVWDASGKGNRLMTRSLTIIYGVVRYRDIFNKQRETWFGYRVVGYKTNRQFVRLAGHPKYNRHT